MLNIKVFDDQTNVLTGGSEVTGVVYMNTNKEYLFSGVKLELIGKEKVHLEKLVQTPAPQQANQQPGQPAATPQTERIQVKQSHKFLEKHCHLELPSHPIDGHSVCPSYCTYSSTYNYRDAFDYLWETTRCLFLSCYLIQCSLVPLTKN